MTRFTHENTAGFTDEEISAMNRIFNQKINALPEEEQENESYRDYIAEQILIEILFEMSTVNTPETMQKFAETLLTDIEQNGDCSEWDCSECDNLKCLVKRIQGRPK